MKKKTKKKTPKKLLTTVLIGPGLHPNAINLFEPMPEPKPQNVADAWDAMQAAGELPANYRDYKVNPYRAAQDRADAFVTVYRPLDENDRLKYDPTRRVAPDVHQTQEPIIPLAPQWEYNGCTHRRTPGDKLGSAIAWMEHSQGIITGFCARCPTQFDTRHEEHMELLLANPRAIRSMGRAGQYNTPGSGVGQVYGTPTAIWFYNHFAWVYGIKPWLRKAGQWLRKDF